MLVMLADAPWYVWLLAFGLVPVIGLMWLWEHYRPVSGGRYAQSWHRFHRAVIVIAFFQGPILTILFTLMLAASDREMVLQRHQALLLVTGLRGEFTAMQATLAAQREQLDTQQPLLDALMKWEQWHDIVQDHLDTLENLALYQLWVDAEWKKLSERNQRDVR